MAKRQRVRAARAQRKLERKTNKAEVTVALMRLARFATTAQLVDEAPDVAAVVKTRQALRTAAQMRRQAMARWVKARATGWARGMTLETGVVTSAAA